MHSMGSRYVGKHLEFRVRLFNVLAFIGVLVSLLSAIVALAIEDPLSEVVIYLCACLLSLGLLIYSTRTGKYQRCYGITIVVIFLIGFPLFFWRGGAYYGAMPYFFVFAILFTIFMLNGKWAILLSALELAVYVAICLYAYVYFPVHQRYLDSGQMLIETVFGFSVVSVALGAAMYIHFSGYNRQQRELVSAREEALRLSEVKNVFLANMSHEIRTPINIMLGMTDMVLRENRDDTVSEYARRIQNAGNMLLILVSNILDFSKIESGKLETHEGRYHTAHLIRELYEIGVESARKRGLAYHMRVENELPAELFGDMPRIKQIAVNFISNAAKYTHAGSITLSAGCKRCDEEEHTVLCVSVEDTGTGITKENQTMIFDAFTRLDLPEFSSVEGTGLGLAIAKQIAEGMGGRIFVESEYGKGSTFRVEIPQKIIDGAPMGDWRLYDGEDDRLEESFTAPEARILVVDDNRENLETVKALLRRTLMRVDLVESGAQCLQAAKETEYHIILMDYMMPDMNGIETLRRLREIPGFSAAVIALTANAVVDTEEKMLAEGFAAYIAKPVRAWDLEKALEMGLARAQVNMLKRTIHPQIWVTPELREALARDLASRGVSLEEGLKNASGDISLLARMADAFTRNYPASVERMQGAGGMRPLALDELRRLAHSLKSTAGYVGANDLSFHAKLIEQSCREGDSHKAALVLPLLYLEWERANLALAAFAAHVHAVEPKGQQKMRGQGDFAGEPRMEAFDARGTGGTVHG